VKFENVLLNRISGHTRIVVTRGWREQHNEKIRNLLFLAYKIRMMSSMECEGYVALMGENQSVQYLDSKH
jgi:hypothetical protein